MRLEVLQPAGQRHGVVDTQILLMLDLEVLVLHGVDQHPDVHKLPVREDVAVDEAVARVRPLLRVGAGDAVVEQPTAVDEP